MEFELLRKKRFATKAEARREVARYIDRYNRVRRHSACQMEPPVEYEAILAARAAHDAPQAEAALNPRGRKMSDSITYQEPSTVGGKPTTPSGT